MLSNMARWQTITQAMRNDGIRKTIFLLLAVGYASHAGAAAICHQSTATCELYLDKTGSLIERSTGNRIANNIGEVGVFSNISIYKYDEQYALVQKNNSNDRLITVIPLIRSGDAWSFRSVYYFSISFRASSAKSRPFWLGRKIGVAESKIDDNIWDRVGELASERKFDTLIPSGWPDTILYVATGTQEPKGEQCFVPFDPQDTSISLEVIACRPLKSPISDGHHDFSGVLGQNLFVDFRLDKKGDAISGRYRYLRHPDKFIKTEGTLMPDGTFSILEFGKKDGDISGYFRGTIKAHGFSGEWESADKSKRLPFVMYLQGFPQ